MILDKKLIDQFSNITSEAAVACHKYIGKDDKVIADKAATDSMRENLNKLYLLMTLKGVQKKYFLVARMGFRDIHTIKP